MAKCELSDDDLYIFVKTNWAEGDLIRQAPGFNWRPKETFPNTDDVGIWRAKVSWAGCLALRGIFGPSLQVGPRLTTWATDELAERITPANIMRNLTELPDEDTSPEAEVVRSWR